MHSPVSRSSNDKTTTWPPAAGSAWKSCFDQLGHDRSAVIIQRCAACPWISAIFAGGRHYFSPHKMAKKIHWLSWHSRFKAIEIFWSRPTLWDVANAASHDIGARNAIEFFEVVQALEMLRVPLVTILARKMRLKVFSTISGAKLPITWLAALGNLFKVHWKDVNFQSHVSRQYRD